ncbi:MAG: hypothetical protein GY756_21410 [bacterium]|nr:hypothetical protein [bacterium]
MKYLAKNQKGEYLVGDAGVSQIWNANIMLAYRFSEKEDAQQYGQPVEIQESVEESANRKMIMFGNTDALNSEELASWKKLCNASQFSKN